MGFLLGVSYFIIGLLGTLFAALIVLILVMIVKFIQKNLEE